MNTAYGVTETRSFWERLGLSVGLTLLGSTFFLVAFVLAIAGDGLISTATNTIGIKEEHHTLAPNRT